MKPRLIQTFMLGLATLVVGCGGSGPSRTQASAPSAGTVALSGPVMGSSTTLAFSGQPLLVGGALVTDQGSPDTAASIKPGSVIRGSATKNSQGFRLENADVRHAVEGPIASVDLTGSKLVVLGQPVRVDALTVIEQEVPGGTDTSLTLADLKVGDVVEVDGARNADESIQASRIEREPGSAVVDLFVRGPVGALDATAQTFQVGGLTIAYGTAVVTGTLANGVEVVVHGTLSGTVFTATRVVVQMDEDASEANLEVSGYLSGLDSTAKTFLLMAYTVDYSKALVEGTLANGARVEVEGTLDTSGATPVLRASKVEVAFPSSGSGDSDGEVTGIVVAVSMTDMTVSIGSAIFWTDSATLFVKAEAPATLADVKVGSAVEIHFLSTKTNAAGQSYATKVEILPS
jgi:hypothetical protein